MGVVVEDSHEELSHAESEHDSCKQVKEGYVEFFQPALPNQVLCTVVNNM